MKGAVAAGHPLTTEAAQLIYEAGGNAFDAALAALAAACVVEPVLTSLGGGGFLLARPAGAKTASLYDFFVQTPRRRRDVEDIEFYPVIADFGTAQQEFHIGAGSIATPGTVRGLVGIHRRLGSLPLREILAPAIGYAAHGVRFNALQAYISSIVAPIYRATPEAAALYGDDGAPPEGSLFRQPRLADTLEWIGAEGDAPFYEGELARRLVALSAQRGGHLTLDDLQAYSVIVRPPLLHRYRSHRVATNPAPSSGGVLISFALASLDELELGGRFGSPRHLTALARVMVETNSAREGGLTPRSARHRELLDTYNATLDGHPLNSRGTTHISTIDAAGNCAALTLSNGEGSGQLLPDTGVMLNNMLGEEDLNPNGFHAWPCDTRVSSMMAPTLADDGRRLIAIGSGGSNRLRTAILQTLSNLIDFAMTPEAAVAAPRIHVERGQLDIEPGFDEESRQALTEAHPRHRVWAEHNLFFGGTHTVCWDGRSFSGAGDPRRGGVFATAG